MSDEHQTQETENSRTFEERVFARFDALDARLSGMDERLQSLEAKQYDTKPIWERALAEIAGVKTELIEFREQVEIRLDRIESMTNQTRAEMLPLRADFREFRNHLKETV